MSKSIHLKLSETDEVKSCPFCGCDAELKNTWTACYWLECQGCEAKVTGESEEDHESITAHEKAKASALEYWNCRVAV